MKEVYIGNDTFAHQIADKEELKFDKDGKLTIGLIDGSKKQIEIFKASYEVYVSYCSIVIAVKNKDLPKSCIHEYLIAQAHLARTEKMPEPKRHGTETTWTGYDKLDYEKNNA